MTKSKWLCMVLLLVTLLIQGQVMRMAVGPQSGPALRDYFTMVYEAAGYELEFHEYPTTRQIHLFNLGELDCIIFTSEDLLRYEIKNGVGIGFEEEPLLVYPLMGYVHKDRVTALGAKETFDGVTILFIHGNPYHENTIMEMGATPRSAPNINSAIQLIMTGRADILMTAPRAPDAVIIELGFEGEMVAMPRPIAFNNYYHIIRADYEDVIEAIQHSLSENKDQFLLLLRR